MTRFKDFLHWYNNKVVVPALGAMQKMTQFYHAKNDSGRRYVETWIKSSESSKYMSTQIYKLQFLTILRK